ncbi:glycosyltransferase [Pseudogulbenkiania sp. MAI-1]|uniref:glycosyltransferase n=1 Tax=Pseudogulbenkiania sp. MAI-1 TaxID=990370 RepID=UPI00045E978D|nr:glycosyltransferase [Pseudogulbenkiania sp. MAI-1]
MSRPTFPPKPAIQRILVLIPSAYLFYLNQGMALRQAFQKAGVDCLLMVDGMGDDSMRALLGSFMPQAVLSINHPRPAAMESLRHTLHLRWIQDNQFGQNDYRQQSENAPSDICYFATRRLQNVIPLQGRRFTGTLRFAATPAATPPAGAPDAAFSLVGYIPPAPLLDASFQINAFQRFTGWDYLSYLERTQQHSLDTSLEQLDSIVETFLNQQGTSSRYLPADALRLFREEYFRAFNRLRLTRQVLSLGRGCRIYGTPEWQSWAEFLPYFQGMLATRQENDAVFRATTINLHNGGTLSHPRVFECMAARGGALMANRTPVETELGFEPGVHFVEYDLSDFNAAARDLLDNPEKRRAISDAAYRLICEQHTWDHRVQQILTDILR